MGRGGGDLEHYEAAMTRAQQTRGAQPSVEEALQPLRSRVEEFEYFHIVSPYALSEHKGQRIELVAIEGDTDFDPEEFRQLEDRDQVRARLVEDPSVEFDLEARDLDRDWSAEHARSAEKKAAQAELAQSLNLDLEEVELPADPKSDQFDPQATYLALWNGEFHVGQFRPVWFGWHFHCGWGASGGFQYDPPGENQSSWQRLWKLDASASGAE